MHRIFGRSEDVTMILADMSEIVVLCLGSFAIGLAFGIKIQSVIRFLKHAS